MMLFAGRCQFIARDKSGGCFFSLSPSPSPEAGIGVTSIDTPRERAAVFTPTRREQALYFQYAFTTAAPSSDVLLEPTFYHGPIEIAPTCNQSFVSGPFMRNGRLQAARRRSPSLLPSFFDPCQRIFSLSLFFFFFINISLCTFFSLLFGINYKVFRDPFQVIYTRKASYRVLRLQSFLKKAAEIRDLWKILC